MTPVRITGLNMRVVQNYLKSHCHLQALLELILQVNVNCPRELQS